MAWQVLLEISDCASHARIPYPTITDGVSTYTGDGVGHFLAIVYDDGVLGWGLRISAANYPGKVVDIFQTQNGQTVPVCLDRGAVPTPTGPGPTSNGW
jgi:hypothetical protein